MKVYTTDKIRNVVLLGHGGAGKTTLAEAMCNLTGLTSRKDCKINVLDTPGYFDFVGEVEEAISVADAAIIVVSGKAGVEVGSERAWELCEKYNIPRMFYISDMDVENANYHDVAEKLSDLYGVKIVPFNFPYYTNGKFAGSVNVITQKAYEFSGKNVKEVDVPADCQDHLEHYHDTLMETVAETSEEFMERYFEGDEFTEEEILEAVGASVKDGSVVPVEMGASALNLGVSVLLDDIVNYLPDAGYRKISGTNLKSGEAFEADYDASKPKSAFIFKTIVDPFIGRYSLIKVNSGVMKTDDTVYDNGLDTELRLGKLYIMCGNKTSEIGELHAGDIGAVAKLGDAKTGDTLSTKATQISYPAMQISTPYTYIRYKAKNKNDVDKIAQAMTKISSEDPTFKMVNDADNRQTLMYGIGDMQLEVVKSMLKNEYKVEIETMAPKVAYRETSTVTSR